MKARWVKGLAAAVTIAACVGFVAYVAVSSVVRRKGLDPNEVTELELTCTNPDCPGRTVDRETGKPVPFTVKKMLRTGFTDWPLPCPECGRKSLYHVMKCPMCAQFEKVESTWEVHDLSDPEQFKCPRCGFSPY
jgi:hypothetical protein